MTRTRTVLGALAIAGCGGSADDASIVIEGRARCSECRVQLIETARVGTAAGAGQPDFPSDLLVAGERIFLAPTLVRGTAAVFDKSGAFDRSIGRFGSGPGEMREIHSVARWRGDSVAVIHDANFASIFDDSLQYARTVTFPARSFSVHNMSFTDNGRILAVRAGTRGGEDYPLREFSLDGVAEQGFGTETPFGQGEPRAYASAVTAGDTAWAVNLYTYEIDVFLRSDARLMTTIRRDAVWFPKDAVQNEWGGRPRIIDITRQSDGRVWVLSKRPRPGFTIKGPVNRSGEEAAAAAQYGVGDEAERFEFMLELLDLARREPVVSVSLSKRVVGGFTADGQLFGYDEDPETGSLAVVVWRLNLIEPRR